MAPITLNALLSRYVPPALMARSYYWTVAKRYLSGQTRQQLKRNRKLKDIHVGKRCFILGNGRSLREQDLSLLSGEFVIAVNEFVQHAPPPGVDPFCYVAADPYYFDLTGPGGKLLADIRTWKNSHPDMISFYPVDHAETVSSFVPDAHYLLMAGDEAANRSIDLSSAIAGVYNVVQVGAMIALYMGFSQIYLLGCDTNMLQRIVGVAPLRIQESHYYENDAVLDFGKLGFDYESYMRRIIAMLANFKALNQLVPPGQKIYNATRGGLLDVFERVEYETLFSSTK